MDQREIDIIKGYATEESALYDEQIGRLTAENARLRAERDTMDDILDVAYRYDSAEEMATALRAALQRASERIGGE